MTKNKNALCGLVIFVMIGVVINELGYLSSSLAPIIIAMAASIGVLAWVNIGETK